MRIVIAGCGRVGSDLARWLADAGNDVSVIDSSREALERLGNAFDGTVHVGLAYDVRVLEEAGIRSADVFLAVTDSDNSNLMAVEVAKTMLQVPRAIARLDDPSREDAYRALRIDYVAAAKIVAKVLYEQVLEPEFDYHLTFPSGDVEIVEMTLGSAADGVRLEELEIGGALRVAAVRRNGSTMVPGAGFVLHDGDLVVAAARHGVRDRVAHLLEEDGS